MISSNDFRPGVTIQYNNGVWQIVEAMHVKPGKGEKTRTGDYAFEIKDPDGMLVEFVQSLPDGLEAKAAGKFEPPAP